MQSTVGFFHGEEPSFCVGELCSSPPDRWLTRSGPLRSSWQTGAAGGGLSLDRPGTMGGKDQFLVRPQYSWVRVAAQFQPILVQSSPLLVQRTLAAYFHPEGFRGDSDPPPSHSLGSPRSVLQRAPGRAGSCVPGPRAGGECLGPVQDESKPTKTNSILTVDETMVEARPFAGISKGIIIPWLLRWCRVSSVHSTQWKPQLVWGLDKQLM